MNLPKIIATFFGLGYIPFAPGTFGALGGLAISYCMVQSSCSYQNFQLYHIGLIITAYFAGVYACRALVDEWGQDPSKVVIDETLGFWVSILFLPVHLYTLIAGFVLFRFFDILKPLGIRKIDQMHTPHSVMLDDVAAGIYANLVLHLLFYVYPIQ